MNLLAVGVGISTAAAVFIANVDWFSKTPATPYSHLSNARLSSLDGKDSLLASRLWASSGAVVMVVRRQG